MQAGDLDGAVVVRRDALRLQPSSAEGRYNLGVALKQQDDFAGAEAELRQAIALDPKLPEARFTLGVVLWQTGRSDEAVRAFREVIARSTGLWRSVFHARHHSETAEASLPTRWLRFAPRSSIARRPRRPI